MPNLSLAARGQALVVRGLAELPAPVVRRLAGRPYDADGATLSAQSQLLLRLQRVLRVPPVEQLDLDRARREMLRQAMVVGGRLPVGEVQHRTVRGADGPLSARLYVPRGAPAVTPLLVFFHGGGMMFGDLDSHDAPCRLLAEEAGVRVLSVAYRLAPEHRFPAGVDDASAAYAWVAERAGDFGADPARLAVGGDSAGGYLAAATAIRAAEEELPLAFQLLVYPWTDASGGYPSRRRFSRDLYLTDEFVRRADEAYWEGHDPGDPRLSVMCAKVPDGLAPALVATAGFDPLRDEGEAYAAKLAEAGVRSEVRRYPGEVHGFFNVVGVPGSARDAVLDLAHTLATALH